MDLAGRAAKREYDRKRYLVLREQTLQRTREYRLKNPELARARVAACSKAKPEVSRAWTINNREKVRAAVRKWDKENKGRKNAIGAKRRAAQMQRTPAWSDFEATAMIYAMAEVAKVTWPDVEVDHILPLQGGTVSGLHVPNNLRVIPLAANRSKGNSFHI